VADFYTLIWIELIAGFFFFLEKTIAISLLFTQSPRKNSLGGQIIFIFFIFIYNYILNLDNLFFIYKNIFFSFILHAKINFITFLTNIYIFIIILKNTVTTKTNTMSNIN